MVRICVLVMPVTASRRISADALASSLSTPDCSRARTAAARICFGVDASAELVSLPLKDIVRLDIEALEKERMLSSLEHRAIAFLKLP